MLWQVIPMTLLTTSICSLCKHFRDIMFPRATCDAFRDGIPPAILSWEHDHRIPFLGNQGIIFEPREEADEFVRRYLSDKRS
jgi:hypothetical protein